MDGASKFVRGDAVAADDRRHQHRRRLFIGVVQGGLDVRSAAEIYTILTIGDGLVSQLPALLISTAAASS
jgi:flagellar biosynthesis protein FlhA